MPSSAARRELELLAAAINYHVKDMLGGVQALFRPVLPDALPARERWLTRSEAARLIWAAWRKRCDFDGAEKGGIRHGTLRGSSSWACTPGRGRVRSAVRP